ncbi:MAG: ABC transporter ATP-binding protein [Campylobacterales bacterium]
MIEIDVKKRLNTAEGPIDLVFEGRVNEGEFITLFGQSGAGKTTLLRMIAGLTAPDEGRIAVAGETWFDSAKRIDRPPQKRRVGFVFQDYALFPNMSVRENIAFALPRSERVIVDELLETTGLAQLKDRKPESLSGGQKQRVALARALALKPKILLLDEPLSALDHAMRSQLQEELLILQKRYQPATLLVSHDLSEVFKLSSRVYVIDRGRVVKSGAPAHVFAGEGVSSKFRLSGEILHMQPSGLITILTVLAGGDVVKVTATESEMAGLKVGSRILIASKAFNPIITPLG